MDDILPEDVEMIVNNIKRAVALYASDPATYNAMQVAAMKAAKDYSWVKATKQYVSHFLVSRSPAPRSPPPSASANMRTICGLCLSLILEKRNPTFLIC